MKCCSSPSVRETWSHIPSSWPKQTEPPPLLMPNSSILRTNNHCTIMTAVVKLMSKVAVAEGSQMVFEPVS